MISIVKPTKGLKAQSSEDGLTIFESKDLECRIDVLSIGENLKKRIPYWKINKKGKIENKKEKEKKEH